MISKLEGKTGIIQLKNKRIGDGGGGGGGGGRRGGGKAGGEGGQAIIKN